MAVTNYNTKSKAMMPTYGPSLNAAKGPYASIAEAEQWFATAGVPAEQIYPGTEVMIESAADGHITTYMRERDRNGIGRWAKQGESTGGGSTAEGVCDTYVIELDRWGITEGRITAATTGRKYTDEQYRVMIDNGYGFTHAINWAHENGYSKVKVPKGVYCFTPRSTNIKSGITFDALIWIRNARSLDIDLCDSTLMVLMDSNHHSEWDKVYGDVTKYPSFWNSGALIQIDWCEHVSIHDGTLIGDCADRTWWSEDGSELTGMMNVDGTSKKKREVEVEFFSGIRVGSYSHYTDIHHMNLTMFAGDGVMVMATPFASGYHESGKESSPSSAINLAYPNYLKNSSAMYYLDSSWKVARSTSHTGQYSISPIFRLHDATGAKGVYRIGTQYENIARLKADRHYQIRPGNGTARRIDLAEQFQILTYGDDATDTAIDMPKRIIECTHMMDFYLQDDETQIAIQVLEDNTGNLYKKNGVLVTDNARELKACICGYAQDNTEIHHCSIYNNHRGGLTGFAGNVFIHHNKFFKSGPTAKKPIFVSYASGVDYTNYHIDNEDVTATRLVITDNEFLKTHEKVGMMFVLNTKELIFQRNRLNSSMRLTKVQKADVSGNVFLEDTGVNVAGWIDSKSDNSSGEIVRVIDVHDNFMTSFCHTNKVADGADSIPDMERTKLNFHHNSMFITADKFPWCAYSLHGKVDDDNYLITDNIVTVHGNANGGKLVLGVWRRNKITFERVAGGNPANYFDNFDSSNEVEVGVNGMLNPMILGVRTIDGYVGRFMSGPALSGGIADGDYLFRNCTFVGSNEGNQWTGATNLNIRFENCRFMSPIKKANIVPVKDAKVHMVFVDCDFTAMVGEDNNYLFGSSSQNITASAIGSKLPDKLLVKLKKSDTGDISQLQPIAGTMKHENGKVSVYYNGWIDLN